MAWRSLSKEGIGLIAAILLQVIPIVINKDTDIYSKIIVVVLFVIFTGFLMYAPKKVEK